MQVGTKSGLPLKDDIELILRRHGLDFPPRTLTCRIPGATGNATQGNAEWKPREMLHALARDEGLKAICERLRYAQKYARGHGRSAPTWDDVCNVHALIRASSEAEEDWR